ncbi:MAG: phage Gp37/Gp68 family protein [Candidatus Eisenbacteria bacterium]|uniref:Phage Gp37/Gp68 family protein n=1 Tax=Eiseniibacteriota bacterium TaxID=2212470 RepID=A0A948W6L1_UNCEI|nr:phage Gp37/Gp68 family protein [Candidatus Eisenbacteria bacterium]MBU1949388.1 phage Gp37/Gp68 family protein [Candidatus Eisenbacteria bacterium]MBU2690761.1 phage Gp37/Gp68 family protein [Candidatus Eisenbacteria bacterium]
MAAQTSIEWTDATWNPVTGCTKVGLGCKNCYAETLAERWRGIPGHPYEQGFDLKLWPERIGLPLAWKKPKRIFVNSMSDLFHEKVPYRFIDRVFTTMRRCTWHQFQILTKRAERMANYIERRSDQWGELATTNPHICLGTSIETQDYIHRAEAIVNLPSSVRFLSCEPLLGPLDLSGLLGPNLINWVIVGGESGPKARIMDPAWVESIRDQCISAKAPFFFKQWGGTNKGVAGRLLNNRTWDQYPVDEPKELQVQLSR